MTGTACGVEKFAIFNL